MLFSGSGAASGPEAAIVEAVGGEAAAQQDAVEAVSERAPFGVELGRLRSSVESLRSSRRWGRGSYSRWEVASSCTCEKVTRTSLFAGT